jgi:hypothetical protein
MCPFSDMVLDQTSICNSSSGIFDMERSTLNEVTFQHSFFLYMRRPSSTTCMAYAWSCQLCHTSIPLNR